MSEAPVETYDGQLDHRQADSNGCKKWPLPDGGDLYIEGFREFRAAYTRPVGCYWWMVTFIDRVTGKAVYKFGDGTDQFTGKQFTQLMEIRQAAQQWVADVRSLREQLRIGSRLRV